MDWGIVASVVVALALFMVGMMAICMPVCLVMMRRMGKAGSSGMAGCSMSSCFSHQDIDGAIKTTNSVG